MFAIGLKTPLLMVFRMVPLRSWGLPGKQAPNTTWEVKLYRQRPEGRNQIADLLCLMLLRTIYGKESSPVARLVAVKVGEDLFGSKESGDAGHHGSPKSDVLANLVHKPKCVVSRYCH